MALLVVSEVSKSFGGLDALKQVDLDIEKSEIRGLIGPNGAGKTTLFNCITGVYPPDRGTIGLEDEDLTGLPPHRITQKGIARTFQQIRLFGNMTAYQNVLVGLDSRNRAGAASAIFRLPRHRTEATEAAPEASRLLRFVGLERRADELSKNLSYGDQRRVEVARALGTKPRLLLLDEPAAGMNRQEKGALMSLIGQIRDLGITIFLIEHDVKLVMGVCERVAVLDHGIKIADAAPEEVREDPQVVEAYLGKGAASGAAGG